MDLVMEKTRPMALENDFRIWLDVLKLWRSHLTFLNMRLRQMHRFSPQRLGDDTYDKFTMEIEFFSDSILTDYQEGLQNDLEDREQPEPSLSEAKWLEEHSMFDQHMKQLRGEYKSLMVQVLEVLTPVE